MSAENSRNSNKSKKDGAVTEAINKLADRISSFSEKVENIPGKLPEKITVALYFIAHMLMLLVHEPWFDEAVAWLIARDSSLYEILFTAPHYEGHPSLWHLILVPFAKTGAPYELSLCLISLAFTGTAMFLFVFKSPFKRIFRLVMPFTYYLFFQYSVISRPYSMMMLAFVLLAMTYGKRDEHPGRFVLSNFFLCLTSAYGIVIAGGICMEWLIVMLIKAGESSKRKNSNNGESRSAFRIFIEDHLIKKGKIFWLAGLLAYVLFIFWRILPAENAHAVVNRSEVTFENLLIRLAYTSFVVLSDTFITNVYSQVGTIQSVSLALPEMLVAALIGLFILGMIITVMKRKGILLSFLIPYSLFAVFTSVVYFYNHHIGIYLLFIGYILWIAYERPVSEKENPVTGQKKWQENGILKGFKTILLAMMLVIPLYWCISSCVCDIIYEFGFGGREYRYLKDHGLEDCSILAEWEQVRVDGENRGDLSTQQMIFSAEGIGIAPYITGDNIMNSPQNFGYNFTYINRVPTVDETTEEKKKLGSMPIPEILLGVPDLGDIYGLQNISLTDYTKVFEGRMGVRKGVLGIAISKIYVLNSIAEEKGLMAIP